MMILHQSTSRNDVAEKNQYQCCICGTCHRAKVWGIAYHLNHTGAMMATNLYGKFIDPTWCCKVKYHEICSYYNSSLKTNTINSFQTFKFVDVSPSITFQEEIKIDGPDFVIMNLQNLTKFVTSNSICGECNCKGTLTYISYQQSGFDSLLRFQCFNCKKILNLNSSEIIQDSSYRLLSKKVLCATQFSGINFHQLSNAFDLIGLPIYSNESSVYKITNSVWDKISEITDNALVESLRFVCIMRLMADGLSFFGLEALRLNQFQHQCLKLGEKYINVPPEIMWIIWSFYQKPEMIPLFISIDGRWSKARNANECTVIAIESNYDVVIQRFNTIRDRYGKKGNFKGASKCAEGNGVDKIMDWISVQGVQIFDTIFKVEVRSFAHDHDGSTRNIIHNYFPDANEYLDVNHKGKNIAKKVAGLAKGWGSAVSIAFKVAVTVAEDNTNTLKRILNAYVDHWCGNHDECYGNGCESSKPKLDVIADAKLIETLRMVFSELADSADSYKKSAHTQSNESINNVLCKYASKRYDFHKSYSGRIDLAVLIHVRGQMYFMNIMEALKIPVSEYSELKLEKNEAKGLWHRERKASIEYKQRRKDLKAKTKKIHAKVKHVAYKYKEDEIQDETQVQNTQLQLVSEKELEPKNKKKKIDHGVSGCCSCIGQCKRSCPCKSNGNLCGSDCHKGQKTNKCCNKASSSKE